MRTLLLVAVSLLLAAEGNPEGGDQTIRGIYELDGDTFKLCYAAPGAARPTELATRAGSGHTLAVRKRAKT